MAVFSLIDAAIAAMAVDVLGNSTTRTFTRSAFLLVFLEGVGVIDAAGWTLGKVGSTLAQTGDLVAGVV